LGREQRDCEEALVEMTATKPYVLHPDTGIVDVWFPFYTEPVVGRYSVKVTGEQTLGRLFQLHVSDERGASTPLHIHHDADESFYVLAGELTFVVGDERIEAEAGSFALAPKGVPHAFLVRSERAEFLITYAPAGMEGFFMEVGLPVVPGKPRPGPMASDPDELARKAAAYGVEIVGPPPRLG
jgi:quercetin dioxygenase-like cupin family protein